MEIGRALAGNTRAILQLGSASDIVPTFLMRENLYQGDPARAVDIGGDKTELEI